jgi:putative serine protease PepD
LIEDGRVSESGRASLGVSVATVTGGGVVIVEVQKGGPAAQAGLERGQIITSLDGRPTPSIGALTAVLARLKPGQTVKITVAGTDGQSHEHPVTPGELRS